MTTLKSASESFRLRDSIYSVGKRPHRYTLCVTHRCNLDCSYCYVGKTNKTISLETAHKSIDFIFHHVPKNKSLEIGFFGGEPLLEFPLVRKITEMVVHHPLYDPERVSFTVTTNGTIFNEDIAEFFLKHQFKVCFSCDGPEHVQNVFRRSSNGTSVASIVERNLRAAHQMLPDLLVNAVFHPLTFRFLPEIIDYFTSLGLRYIFLNPDFSAQWTADDTREIPKVYNAVAQRYMDGYLHKDPVFISLIDNKIAVLLRGGYHPIERCQMGVAELAITANGDLYPCERLIGSLDDDRYKIGSIESGMDLSRMASYCVKEGNSNPECQECSMNHYCVNWCGCSNAFMTGYYNRVGPFLCASERAAIQTALEVFTTLESQLGPVFFHHLNGMLQVNARVGQKGAEHHPSI